MSCSTCNATGIILESPLASPTTESLAFDAMFAASPLEANNVGAEQRYADEREHTEYVRAAHKPTWQRISKREAQLRFATGTMPVYLCPCKLRPGFPWNVAILVFGKGYLEDAERYAPREDGRTSDLWHGTLADTAWNLMYNNFAYYNLTSETGRYAHYYELRSEE